MNDDEVKIEREKAEEFERYKRFDLERLQNMWDEMFRQFEPRKSNNRGIFCKLEEGMKEKINNIKKRIFKDEL
jgi:hypothetical protein